ncbi:hypothetical protein ACFFJ4_18740 [Xanthomonas dyei]|uniref:Uncharacterized protein n=1 Tax=Xanthomonas dyei TaxID=743699 RepID=A0A2S7BXN9_9XANT|nr:hypothetical protein [Xanthomonas dyei]PPU54088.1 hypothetical protein XdyCFBP7245_20095 [Xanthomonas dyei]
MITNEFKAVHFNVGSSRVHRNGVDLANILGFNLDDNALIQLAGAPTGSTVTLVEKREWPEVDDGENVPSGVLLQVKNDHYFSQDLEVVIFLDGLVDVASLYIKLVMFLDIPERKGIAGHMIGVMVDGAASLPRAKRIRLWAAGGFLWKDYAAGSRWWGYVAWPKYGFDCFIPNATLDLISRFPNYPRGLGGCKKVSDVIRLPGGKDFWKLAGEGDYMDFTLAKNSVSMVFLNDFLSCGGDM